MLNSVGKNDMTDLDALEQDLADKRLLMSGPAEKAMRSLIEEVRKLRAAQDAQPRQWGPWIPWAGGECPIPDAKAGEYDLQFVDGKPSSVVHKIGASTWNWRTRAVMLPITAYRVLVPADDLLRQAIEALTNSCNLLENYIDTFGDMSGANHADLNDYRAVIAAYDKRGK